MNERFNPFRPWTHPWRLRRALCYDVTALPLAGSVDIALRDVDDGYRVDADTMHGSENIAVLNNPSSRRTVIATTANGSVTVRPIG